MMEMTTFQQKISALFPDMEIRFNESMEKHTSFRIGGPAQGIIFPRSVQELGKILAAAAKEGIATRVLGAGTNVLAPDEGLDGLVICLKDALMGMEQLDETRIRVYAGVTMTRAAVFAAERDLGGMEFAHGIPGTVGGGVYMNAGAYGGEIKDICESVDVMDPQGSCTTISAADMDFSYRHSRLETTGGVVVSAVFSLMPKPREEVRARMQELIGRRKASQPLDMPSAGSAFKRPSTGYAAALIEQAGLKGFRVGGAAVSQKHAGFVVNLGGATACEVRTLLEKVSEIVFEKSGIRLEPEVRIW